MCGFLGYISKDIISDQYLKKIDNSAKLISHRGQDSNNAIIGKNFYFKSFRHKILDLSEKGDQPFVDDRNRYFIVFNGIIFNHHEIRNEIISKYNQKFISQCDTETILYGYLYFGEKIFNKMNGYWALAIYDKQNNETILSRDRFGVKPLYYTSKNNSVIFSSEIKSLKNILSGNFKLNLSQINSFLRRGWLDHNNETLYSDILSIKPSTFVKIKNNKISDSEIYWNYPTPNSNNLNLDDIRDALYKSFTTATLSDVPIAALMSSGIDSNALISILSYTDYINKKNIESFTVNPTNFSEDINSIKLSSKIYNIKNHLIDINKSNFNHKKIIDEFIYVQDEPTFNSSHIYQFELRKIISQKNFHVLLTGDGSDEIFSGYKKTYISYLASMFKLLSKKEFIKILKNSSDFMGMNSFELIILLKKYFNLGLNKRSHQENKFGDSILKNDYFLDEKTIFPKYKYSNLDPKNYNYDLFYELMERFRIDIPHVLRNEDRMSSFFHICARPLFLNHNLIEKIWSFHFKYFMQNGSNKFLLRESLKLCYNVSVKE